MTCLKLLLFPITFRLISLLDHEQRFQGKVCIKQTELHSSEQPNSISWIRFKTDTESNNAMAIRFGSRTNAEAQYFYSFKALYDASYEASQMFCFTTQCNQNKLFEKPTTRRCTRHHMRHCTRRCKGLEKLGSSVSNIIASMSKLPSEI